MFISSSRRLFYFGWKSNSSLGLALYCDALHVIHQPAGLMACLKLFVGDVLYILDRISDAVVFFTRDSSSQYDIWIGQFQFKRGLIYAVDVLDGLPVRSIIGLDTGLGEVMRCSSLELVVSKLPLMIVKINLAFSGGHNVHGFDNEACHLFGVMTAGGGKSEKMGQAPYGYFIFRNGSGVNEHVQSHSWMEGSLIILRSRLEKFGVVNYVLSLVIKSRLQFRRGSFRGVFDLGSAQQWGDLSYEGNVVGSFVDASGHGLWYKDFGIEYASNCAYWAAAISATPAYDVTALVTMGLSIHMVMAGYLMGSFYKASNRIVDLMDFISDSNLLLEVHVNEVSYTVVGRQLHSKRGCICWVSIFGLPQQWDGAAGSFVDVSGHDKSAQETGCVGNLKFKVCHFEFLVVPLELNDTFSSRMVKVKVKRLLWLLSCILSVNSSDANELPDRPHEDAKAWARRTFSSLF